MTVESTSGSELNIGQICTAAYRVAGLMNEHVQMTDARARVAREMLDILLKGLQARRIPARSESFFLLGPLTVGTYKYQLPDNVLDVLGTPMWMPSTTIDTDKAETERPIQRIDQETWQTISIKSTDADVPLRCYVHRNAPQVEAWLWPIPTDAGWIRFRVHRLFADTNDANATVDLDRPWTEYLVNGLAHKLCQVNSQPIAKIQYYEMQAEKAFEACAGFGEEHVDSAFTVYHPTAWNAGWHR